MRTKRRAWISHALPLNILGNQFMKHYQKPSVWYPVFWSTIFLLNPLHQCRKLFYYHGTPYLHTDLWEISSAQIAVAKQIDGFHVRHPLLQEPVSKAHFSTQCFCHQMCNANRSNPLHWPMCKAWSHLKQVLCGGFSTLASTFWDHAWALCNPFYDFLISLQKPIFANHQKNNILVHTARQ